MQRLQYTLHPLERKFRLQVAIVGLNGIAIIDDLVGIEEQRIDAHVAVILKEARQVSQFQPFIESNRRAMAVSNNR